MIDGVPDALAIIGEVHTCLVHHSHTISAGLTERVLRLVEGEPIRRSIRPIAYAISPDVLTGVDCLLPSGSGSRTRAVGTVVSRAAVTGGRILQASSYVTVVPSPAGRRLTWSHYLSRGGTVEAIGRTDAGALVRGFLDRRDEDGLSPDGRLDLGALCSQIIDRVQGHAGLNHQTLFPSPRGRLRWALSATPGPPYGIELAIGSDEIRRLRLPLLDASPRAHLELCEDIARHDWLLAALVSVVERGLESKRPSPALSDLRVAIDHLLHLWMPAARLDPALEAAWAAIERQPGLSRQWRVNVDRVRDQIALRTLERLSAG